MKVQRRVTRVWSGVVLAFALTWALASGAHAAEVRIAVGSSTGPAVDAVVSLHGATPSVTRAAAARMDQQHSAFVPGVSKRIGAALLPEYSGISNWRGCENE